MQAGIIFGYAGQVDGIVERIREEMGAKPRVIATGGLATLIAEETRSIEEVDPALTLEECVLYMSGTGKGEHSDGIQRAEITA